MRNKLKIFKKLDALEEVIRPSGSLAAKVAALHPEHRRIYEAWKNRLKTYWSQFEGEEAYIALLEHVDGKHLKNPPPVLPYYVREKVFPPSDFSADPFHKYQEAIERTHA